MRSRLVAAAAPVFVMLLTANAALAADDGLPPQLHRSPAPSSRAATTAPAKSTAPKPNTTAPACTSTFNQVSTPNPAAGGGDNSLDAIAGTSPTDLWAVGYVTPIPITGVGANATLAEHWDGSLWSVVPTPAPAAASALLGVATVSSTDAWAVGRYLVTATGPVQALVEHWNGSAWSQVITPTLSRSFLNAVTAVSANDVWAVGAWSDMATGATQPLALHWNGAAWSQTIIAAQAGGPNTLNGITAISANDVWAVGDIRTAGPPNLAFTPLVEHWNGAAWELGTAQTNNVNSYLAAVAGAGAGSQDMWTVGLQNGLRAPQTLTLHYPGYPAGTIGAWTYYANAVSGALWGVAEIAPDKVWAVGDLVQHFNGSAWSSMTDAGPIGTTRWAVWAGGGEVWVVGDYPSGRYLTFAERLCTAPPTPTSVAALPGDTEATVTWAKPASNSSAPITSYTVISAPGGLTITVSATVPAATITGLTNGTSYTFTVTPSTGAVSGVASAPSNAVVPTAVTQGPVVAILPAMTNGAYGGYLTTAYLLNTATAAANIRVQYFDQSGQPVGKGNSAAALPSRATWTLRQDNLDGLASGQAGSAIVYSNQPLAVFVNEFAPGNASDASSYTSIKAASLKLYAPAIANGAYGGYTTGIGLINAGSTATDVTITYRNPAGIPVNVQTLTAVPAGAYRAVYSGDAALGLPVGFAGTATIESSSLTAPLAAVINEVGPGGQFSSYDAVYGGATPLEAPVALNNAYGGYYTGIGIQETSGHAGTVTVVYWDGNGTPTVKPFAIAANGYLGLYQGDPAQGPAPGAYTADIRSDVPIAAIVNEVAPAGSGSARQSTSYNTFVGASSVANIPLVENNGADGWTTGLGVMNTGTAPITVSVSYFDPATGQQLPSSLPNTTPLPGHAFRGIYTPDDLPAGTRASAQVSASGGSLAVICNEAGASTFMSYDGQ